MGVGSTREKGPEEFDEASGSSSVISTDGAEPSCRYGCALGLGLPGRGVVASLDMELALKKNAWMSGGLGVDPLADQDEDADMVVQGRLRNTMAIIDLRLEYAMWSRWAQ